MDGKYHLRLFYGYRTANSRFIKSFNTNHQMATYNPSKLLPLTNQTKLTLTLTLNRKTKLTLLNRPINKILHNNAH